MVKVPGCSGAGRVSRAYRAAGNGAGSIPVFGCALALCVWEDSQGIRIGRIACVLKSVLFKSFVYGYCMYVCIMAL